MVLLEEWFNELDGVVVTETIVSPVVADGGGGLVREMVEELETVSTGYPCQ